MDSLRARLEPSEPADEKAGVRRFTYASGEGWRAAGAVAVGLSTPAIRRIEVETEPPGGDVSALLFRKVSIGLVLAEVQKALALDDARRLGVDALDEVPLYRVDDFTEEPLELPFPPTGYIKMSDTLLRRVAEAYLEETSAGKPPKALERIAQMFGRPPETVRTWVSRARKEGWLGAGVRGRVGAGPGPRLLGYRQNEETALRAAASASPTLTFERTWVRPDPQGKGGTVFLDRIPADGPIERAEVKHVDDWRQFVDDRHAEQE